MGPAPIEPPRGLDIAPHPHTGLQTLTWLVEGEALHRDSLGTQQPIRPGELNLMTAGRGVAHSEEGTANYRGELHGAQLWIAQPSATRDGPPAFEHHATLPQVDLVGAVATVLVGRLGDVVSPARHDTDHVGVDLSLHGGDTTLALRDDVEYALIVLSGAARVDDHVVEPGHLAYLGLGRDEIRLTSRERSRALLVGGVPFEEPVMMWWNYVARTRQEILDAHQSWMTDDGRLGASTRLSRASRSRRHPGPDDGVTPRAHARRAARSRNGSDDAQPAIRAGRPASGCGQPRSRDRATDRPGGA